MLNFLLFNAQHQQWCQNKCESGGHRFDVKRQNFFGRTRPLFGCKITFSQFGERFRDSQYLQFGLKTIAKNIGIIQRRGHCGGTGIG